MIDDLNTKTEEEILALIDAASERLDALALEKKERLYAMAAEVKALCEVLHVPITAVFSKLGTPESFAPKVKYRNEKGETWTGKGKRPDWIKNALKDLTPEQQLDKLDGFRV